MVSCLLLQDDGCRHLFHDQRSGALAGGAVPLQRLGAISCRSRLGKNNIDSHSILSSPNIV